MTTSAGICAGGLALMVLPTLVVGNELLFLAGVGVAVGLWFLAHRHGRLPLLMAWAKWKTRPPAPTLFSAPRPDGCRYCEVRDWQIACRKLQRRP
jgi:hypothetical protein